MTKRRFYILQNDKKEKSTKIGAFLFVNFFS